MGKPNLPKGYLSVSTDLLVENPRNYKETDGAEVERLLDSLENNFKRNGQVENILIRELETGFYEVLNGNHRLMVARRLKMTEMMCYNFGKITEAQADRIAIETNETKFKTDNMKLAETIKSLTLEFDIPELATTLPYTQDEIENFTKLLDFQWEDGEGAGGGGGDDTRDKDAFRKIVYDLPSEVADAFDKQVERFKKILYPEDNIKDVSHIMPIEAMVQVLLQTPDSHILGKEK